nr:putative lipid phosphate phosphatase 3, chloroplastic [Tanacetum cinerariifolium]
MKIQVVMAALTLLEFGSIRSRKVINTKDEGNYKKKNYDHWGNVICTGKDSLIRDGHKSFPSGHTSLSFAGLIFLALYLAGKLKVFDHRGHVAKLCVILLPLLMASLVAVSRVDDYRHHWQDISVGGLLGHCHHLLLSAVFPNTISH